MKNTDAPTRLSLLIVDDDAADRALIKALIQQAEYDVLEATTGFEGIQITGYSHVDCAIVDFNLPDIEGDELIQSLRRSANDPALPVIICTGQGDEEVAVHSMHSGATDYLPKSTLSTPFLSRALFNAIQHAQLNRQLSRERARILSLNHEFMAANQKISAFYQTISHELKTPLMAIRELTSLTLAGVGGPVSEQQKGFLSASLSSCDRLEHMMNDLVDTAHIETGQLSYDRKPMDLNSLIEEAVTLFQRRAQPLEIQFVSTLDPQLPTISGDSVRLGQLVSHLLTNAFKFTDKGGTVRVETRVCLNGGAQLDITDSGKGIEQTNLDIIFERFTQSVDDDSALSQGLGVGLYLCSNIAKNHGGTLDVKSQLGSGSTFSLFIPAKKISESYEN